MHTSWLVFLMWSAGVVLACLAQLFNYLSIPRDGRTRLRQSGFWFGIVATALGGTAAFMAAVDWRTLPMSPEGLAVGQLWDDNGIPAIVESDEKRAMIEHRRP